MPPSDKHIETEEDVWFHCGSKNGYQIVQIGSPRSYNLGHMSVKSKAGVLIRTTFFF